MRALRFALLSAAAAAAGSALAQDARLPAVIVTPDTAPDPSLTLPNIHTARKRIAAVPGGADVVDGDSYREGRVSTLQDSLAYSPGVFSAPRFGAEEARLSIRGSGIQRTFHLRGIKLMQDGVPLNLADGSGDFQAIEPLQTRYIEVYRGANALQYGSSALGGAINYVSVTGYDNWRFLARGEAGSFGYRRAQASGGGVEGRLDWIATVSTFDQGGFRRHARQSAQRATGNLGWKLAADLETRFYFSYAKSDSELPGNLTKAQMLADPRQANPANVVQAIPTAVGDQKRDIDWVRVSSKTVKRYGEARLEFFAYYADKSLFHPIFQVIEQKNEDYGAEVRWVSEASLGGRRNLLTAGLYPSRGTILDDRYLNWNGTRGPRTNQFDQLAENVELYVENQHYAWERTALILGAQHSRNRRRSTDQFVPAGQASESFEKRYSHTSPKIGLRHDLQPNVQLYANYSGSYEPPSFGELVGGLAPNLVGPQTSRTLEIGSRGTLPGFSWDVSLYRAEVKDELLQTLVFPAGNNPVPLPQTVNVPRTIHQGLELGTSGRFGAGYEWRQALFVNRFRFDGDPGFGNNTLPGMPKSLLRAELTKRWGGWFAAVTIESSPSRYPVDMANTFYADAYTIWGAKAGRKVTPRLSWFVEGRNLSNRIYASTTGVTRDLAGADGAQFLPGDGRSFYAGLEYKL
ncbi:MAG: TonB-dependent receptor family protein [Burkholderiales bacterium]